MKRLVALLAAIAVLASMSLTSFAAFTDVIADNGDGTYTAALSGSAATANAGKQTTIVAYKGNTINVGSIQYIDQAAATSFTFMLKDDLTEDVKVVMGGEAIDKQEIGTIKYGSGEPEPTPTPVGPTPTPTYTVSGSVTNAPSQSFITDELTAYVVDLYGAGAVKDYLEGYEITAQLIAADDYDNFIETTVGTGGGYDVAYSATVSFVDGTFAIANVVDGTYALALVADGAMTWVDYVTVNGANASVGSVELLYGDVVGAKDAIIDATDVALAVNNMVDIENSSFTPAFDVSPDCIVDATDIASIVANMGDIYTYNTDFINDNF